MTVQGIVPSPETEGAGRGDTLLETLRQGFVEYADRYIARAPDPGPHRLKQEHTLRVEAETVSLAGDLGLSHGLATSARAVALLHDLGRFRQFETWGTFKDSVSENHAVLALEEMEIHGFLLSWLPRDRHRIREAVRYHNAAAIPGDRDPEETLLMKIIRDADKLDIWRVLVGHYRAAPSGGRDYISWGMEETGGFSEPAVEAVLSGDFVRTAMVRGLPDLKLMQMSWVFDLNFPQSVARVRKRGYIDAIASTLPASGILGQICDTINTYMGFHEGTCQ